MSLVIDRLEQALTYWEHVYRLKAMRLRIMMMRRYGRTVPLIGPYEHWRSFRNYLLHFTGSGFDRQRFIVDAAPGERATLDMLAASIAAWTVNSRQVFHLSSELCSMLQLTTTADLTWSDVHFPFDAFAMTLERPMVGAEGGIPYDCLIVSRRPLATMPELDGGDTFELRLIPATLAEIPFPTREKWDRLERLFQKQRWEKLTAELDVLPVHDPRHRYCMPLFQCPVIPGQAIPDHLDDDEVVRDVPAELHPNARDGGLATSLAIRLAVGLSMYLGTLPSRSPCAQRLPRDLSLRPQHRPVTATAEVCVVTFERKLTREERGSVEREDGQQRPYHEMSTHWRRGHFRRPPGKGDDPTALKTIWVRPCWVRPDRVPEGMLTGGGRCTVE